MSLDSALAKLSAQSCFSFNEKGVASAVAEKDYNQLQRWGNVTSYSVLGVLHQCPRKFQLIKARAARGGSQVNNTDFAFGHAVGAGIQAWLMSRDLDVALFNCMLAWKLPFEVRADKKQKSIWEACHAVMQYPQFFEQTQDDWQVWILPNGKPAIEIAFSLDFENGYKHYGHIDVILQNRHTKALAIQENKTHGFRAVEPAIYANSNQAVSYAAFLDMVADITNYEVFYNCYSAPAREWELVPFTKSIASKVEALREIEFDHAAISTYRKLNYFPKRGDSCFAFMRRCEFFGECNLTATLQPFVDLPAEQEAEEVDFAFKVSDVLAKQRARLTVNEPEEIEYGLFSIE